MEKENTIEIQLGDIIKIISPKNENLDNESFMVEYIDKNKMKIINLNTLSRIKINILADGKLDDQTIEGVEIISRADTPSYARQNGLIPGKWVNILFNEDGDPIFISGQITNLENDTIEVKTKEGDIIYINFHYQGIPEDLPIEKIEIKDKPPTPEPPMKEPEPLPLPDELDELEQEKQFVDAKEIQINIPIKDVKDQIKEMIVRADQVKFGEEELGIVFQMTDVSQKERRYSIEEQASDLMDELLSTIPDAQRTNRVLNNIHITIERFKQLRETFSTFNQFNVVDGMIKKGSTYKPLKKWLDEFNLNLLWILPVVKNVKKIYSAGTNLDDNIVSVNIWDNLNSIEQLIIDYKTSKLPIDKYGELYSQMSNYFRPFEYVDEEEKTDVIVEKEVNANINTILGYYDEFYSSIYHNNMVRNRRFVISKYNLGETKLNTIESTNSKMTTIRVNISPNDILSIKSILTLPEPTIRFSKINLPQTDILTRANLNKMFLNYWELLKQKTNVSNVYVDNLENEFDFNEREYVNGIVNYVMNIPEEDRKHMSKLEIYNKFIETIIPQTKVLFNLMKKYIKGKLSIVDVVGYLEPFLVYTDDLSFKQYQEIVYFIDRKISEYNRNMIEVSRTFKLLTTIRSVPLVKNRAYSIISLIGSNMTDEIFDTSYKLENAMEYLTNSEILRRMTLKDYSKLYTTAIARSNIKLMFPNDMSELFEDEVKDNKEKIKDANPDESCGSIVIAKMYNSLDSLEADNEQIIYFDRRYDKTNYGIMEDHKGYADKVLKLSPEELRREIISDQMNKNRLSEADASYLADTLIDGAKKVLDGQYAILHKGYAETTANEYAYYVRQANKWVLDETMTIDKGVIDDSSILCDLEKKCVSVTKTAGEKCESVKTNELTLQNELLTDILSEFDIKYKKSKEQLEKEVNEKFAYLEGIMPKLSSVEMNAFLKYNNQKFKLGENIENDMGDMIFSPYTQILNIILSQNDFVKKQHDILRFSNEYTRDSLSSEKPYWLYCIKTGAELMPTFKKELAGAFVISQYEYQRKLEELKSKIGKLSDDGDKWTDKNTGWTICEVEFDTEEGYDDAGFKVSTRALIEEDAGNLIMASTTVRTVKYTTIEAIMINNIVNALSVAMGINIETQKEFIINAVIETIRTTVDKESDYKEKIKEAAKKGKTIMPYKEFYNTVLLYCALGMFLIVVQTSIPSVKTRKTHPGCVRSFSGYPFEGNGDMSSLKYLACITSDLKSPVEPWNVLHKKGTEKIEKQIEAFINKYLIQLADVQRKIMEKTEYLLTAPPSDIPAEHDISNWGEFLPPLMPFKITSLNNISKEFHSGLNSDLRSGSSHQTEKIHVIESKNIQFSLAIQEKINSIVKKHNVLLHTANNVPYLENACCDSKDGETTIGYFVSKNPEIKGYNDIVKTNMKILDDIRSYTEAYLFYSNINTKMIYPSIQNIFDEKTIYMAYIYYCKFKSLMPIPTNLLPYCTDKPDQMLVNSSDTINNIIQKLKEDGRHYTNENLLRLLQIISRENIVNINLDENNKISTLTRLESLLDEIYDENNGDEIVENALIQLIQDVIQTFDVGTENPPETVDKLNNYLSRVNKDMKTDIIEFIRLNSSYGNRSTEIKNFIKTIDNLSQWNIDEETGRNSDIKITNENLYKITNLYKTFVDNFVNVFPNIILKGVNYTYCSIHSYYGFSDSHVGKLRKSLNDYYAKLVKFNKNPKLSTILNKIQNEGKNIVTMSQMTPCFSDIKFDDVTIKGIIDDITGRYLFEYYLLRVLKCYIDLTDDNDMIVTEISKNKNVTDLYTVDHINDMNTSSYVETTISEETSELVIAGNKRELRRLVSDLLICYVNIFNGDKDLNDYTYGEIQDMIFKIKEAEKNKITDQLKEKSDELREVDTVFKSLKLGDYGKGLQKGLTTYDEEYYEKEADLRETIDKTIKKIKRKNKGLSDEEVNNMVDDVLENDRIGALIDTEAYDMSELGEDYWDGNTDGYDNEDAYREED